MAALTAGSGLPLLSVIGNNLEPGSLGSVSAIRSASAAVALPSGILAASFFRPAAQQQ